MATSMFGSGNPLMLGGNGQARAQEALEDVTTDAVGFVSLNGDTRNLRFLPSPWPSNALPPPTASLFTIASREGLIAAADPNKLVIAQTKDVRTDLARTDGPEQTVKNLSRSMLIDLPTRVSQVTFSSDEKYLVISAVEGGGLQIYETNSIKQNKTEHAFQIATNNISVQALIPNPAQDQGHVFAVVLSDGKLMIVSLREQQFLNNPQGNPVLRDGDVTCCSWSAKGKQLVAGLRDGTAVQLKPDGQVQATIPKPPSMNDPKADDCYLASILWLDNTRFLNIYSPKQDTSESRTYIVTKHENTFAFRKLATEPTVPFSPLRQPPHFFINRLRDYEPDLKDALFISTTCGPDIGLVAHSATPLAREAPNTANAYSNAVQVEDARRAQMPASASEEMTLDEPSALGVALDLSPDEPVKRPIPQQADAIEQTPHPVPALMALNHEGILSAWWFVYNDAILQNRIYKGMNQAPNQPAQPASFVNTTNSQPAFGQSGLQAPSTTTAQPVALGASPWGSQQRAPAFGQSAFGAPSFGSPSQPALGTPASPSQAPAFGSATALGGNQKVFGSNSNPAASPFSKVGTQGISGFSAFAANKDTNTKSPFAAFNNAGKTSSLFGASSTKEQTFGSAAFGQMQNQQSGWGFGQPEKKDDQLPAFGQQPSTGSTMTIGSSFGSFGKPSVLGSDASPWVTPSLSNNASNGLKADASKAQDEDADMDMDKKADGILGSGISGLGLGNKKEEPVKEPGKTEIDEKAKQPVSTAEPKIKQEPQDDAPLPPEWSSKPVGEKPSTPKSEEPPLPPEPSDPLPPSPSQDESSQDETKETQTPVKEPLSENEKKTTTPKSPASVKDQDAVDAEKNDSQGKDEPSPAGSEPEIVEAEKSIPTSPTKSIATEPDTTINLDKAGTWPRQKSPVQPTPQKSLFGGDGDTPTGSFSFGQTPTGTMPKPPVIFPPRGAESPRSPSPIRRIASPRGRSALSPTRLTSTSQDRTVSSPATQFAPTPHKPSQPLRSHLVNEITPTKSSPAPSVTPSVQPPRTVSPVPSVDFTAAQETEDRVHEELGAPVRSSKTLKAFIAHNDYVNDVAGTSFASQIERLYRDGNSMVDTLGLNARTLQQFIAGHEELYRDGEREVDDLEPDSLDNWALAELEDLGVIQKNLSSELDASKPSNVRETLFELRDIHRAVVTIRNKRVDLSRTVADVQALMSTDSATPSGVGKSKPKLAPQQTAVLRDLRKQYAQTQTLLAQAEDAVSLLRAKVVTQEARSSTGNESGRMKEIPTAEAVVNTIAKMTRMAEQKRGDVDLLEARLKKMKRESISRAGSEEHGKTLGRLSLGGSGTRAVTPRKSIRKETKKAGYGFSYSDDEDEAGGQVSVKREYGDEDDLVKSTTALTIRQSTPQQIEKTGVSGLSAVELEDIIERRANRRKVLDMFKEEIMKRGPKMRDLTT